MKRKPKLTLKPTRKNIGDNFQIDDIQSNGVASTHELLWPLIKTNWHPLNRTLSSIDYFHTFQTNLRKWFIEILISILAEK